LKKLLWELQFIEKVIMDDNNININKHFNGKACMSILIDNIVDNEELFNMLYKKGSYINFVYDVACNNLFTSFVRNNLILLKSIICKCIIKKKL